MSRECCNRNFVNTLIARNRLINLNNLNNNDNINTTRINGVRINGVGLNPGDWCVNRRSFSSAFIETIPRRRRYPSRSINSARIPTGRSDDNRAGWAMNPMFRRTRRCCCRGKCRCSR
jgi:hypothetical protein